MSESTCTLKTVFAATRSRNIIIYIYVSVWGEKTTEIVGYVSCFHPYITKTCVFTLHRYVLIGQKEMFFKFHKLDEVSPVNGTEPAGCPCTQ